MMGAESKVAGILALLIGAFIFIPGLLRAITGFATAFVEGSAEVIFYSIGALIACVIGFLIMRWGYKKLKE